MSEVVYSYTNENATKPILTKDGYILKVLSGTPASWYKRGCGTKAKHEADLVADLVAELRKMNNTLGTEMIDKLGVHNTLKLADLRERYHRRQWDVNAKGDPIEVSMKQALIGIREDLVAEAAAKEAATKEAVKTEAITDIITEWMAAPHDPADDRAANDCRRFMLLPDFKRYNTVKAFTTQVIIGLLCGNKALGLTNPHLMTTSKRRYLASFRALIAYLILTKRITDAENPARKGTSWPWKKFTADEVEARKEVLNYEEEEVKRIVFALTAMGEIVVAAMVALMFASGAELGACWRLKKSHFSATLPKAHIPGTKNSFRARDVFLSIPWCRKIVLDYVATITGKEAHFWPREFSYSCHANEFRAAMKKACAAAGVKYIGFHKLRHSFAAYWMDQGIFEGACLPMDVKWLKDQLGHSDGSNILMLIYARRKVGHNLDAIMAATLQREARMAALANGSMTALNAPNADYHTDQRNDRDSLVSSAIDRVQLSA